MDAVSRRTVLGRMAVGAAIAAVGGSAEAESGSGELAPSETSRAGAATRVAQPFQIAAVQAVPAYLDLPGGVSKAIGLIQQASRAGARLIAFPELWLPGYPFAHPSRDWQRRVLPTYIRNSMTVGDAQWSRLLAAAAADRIAVSFSFSEREGDHLFMGQCVVDERGVPVVVRRKLRPSGGERAIWSDGTADGLKVVDTMLGRIGALSCWEHMHPQMTFLMQSQREDIHVGAWPCLPRVSKQAWAGPEVNMGAARYYATVTESWVVAPCGVNSEAMRRECDTYGFDWVPTGGGAARIFLPDGSEAPGALGEHEEGLVMATVDPSLMRPYRRDPSSEFSWGVLELITANYGGPHEPDPEHGVQNMVSLSALLSD